MNVRNLLLINTVAVVGWSAVAIYLFFTLGWAFFLRAKPAAGARSGD
jgi:hypothetical protein